MRNGFAIAFLAVFIVGAGCRQSSDETNSDSVQGASGQTQAAGTSSGDLAQLEILFRNFRDQAIEIYAFDPATDDWVAEPYLNLEPGAEGVAPTYAENVWEFRENGEAFGGYVATSDPKQLVDIAPDPEPGTLTVRGLFANSGSEPIVAVFIWENPENPEEILEREAIVVAPSQIAPLDLFPGNLLEFRRQADGSVVGFYVVTEESVQEVDILALDPVDLAPEPEGASSGSDSGEVRVVNPIGAWADANRQWVARFYTLEDGRLGWAQLDGSAWVFSAVPNRPNVYQLDYSMDSSGLPFFVPDPDAEPTELRFLGHSVAEFIQPGQSKVDLAREQAAGLSGLGKVGINSDARPTQQPVAPGGLWTGRTNDREDQPEQTWVFSSPDATGSFERMALGFPGRNVVSPAPGLNNVYYVSAFLDPFGLPETEVSFETSPIRLIFTSPNVCIVDHARLLPTTLTRQSAFVSFVDPAVSPMDPAGAWALTGNAPSGSLPIGDLWYPRNLFVNALTLRGTGPDGKETLTIKWLRRDYEIPKNIQYVQQIPKTLADKLKYDKGDVFQPMVGQANVYFRMVNEEGKDTPTPVFLTFSSPDDAWMQVEGQSPMYLARSEEEEAKAREKANRVVYIPDQSYDRWLRVGQNPNWEEKTEADLAVSPIDEGYVNEKLASHKPSYLGYNVLKMNPGALGSPEGRGIQTPGGDPPQIFASLKGTSREWTAEGSFRIPWHLRLQAEVEGRGGEASNMSFSESERQKSFGVDLRLPNGLGGGYSKDESSSDSRQTVTRRRIKWASEYWLTLDKRYVQLSAAFKKRVRTMGHEFKDYEYLFDNFGTHYSLSTLYGGSISEFEELDLSAYASNISKSWSASYERSAQIYGINVEAKAGFSSTDSSGTSSRTESGEKQTITNGGTGTSFESWSLGANKTLIPIQVDLRPIHELILPRLFEVTSVDDFVAINQRRAEMERMYDQYIQTYAIRYLEADRKPKVYGITVVKVMMKKNDDYDDLFSGFGAEIYGSIEIRLAEKGSRGNFRRTPLATVWSSSEVVELDTSEVFPDVSGAIGKEFLHFLQPLASWDERQKVWATSYASDETHFQIDINLKEKDYSGGGDEDSTGHAHIVPFSLISSSPGSEVVKTLEVDVAAMGVIAYTVRMREISISNKPEGVELPKPPTRD